MLKLGDLKTDSSVPSILPGAAVPVVNVERHGSTGVIQAYRGPSGWVGNEILYWYDEPRVEVFEVGRPWSFRLGAARFRVISLLNSLRLQIAAVYGALLTLRRSAFCSPLQASLKHQ